MCKILIFGGTTEGRLLAEFCEARQIPAVVSVVSGYGKDLIRETSCVRVEAAALDGAEMEKFLRAEHIGLAVDATHPYAVSATENIRRACEAAGVRRIRCLRDAAGRESREKGDTCSEADGVVRVPTVEAAVSYLQNRPGKVFVTTGSKELAAFTGLTDFKERVYVRVLPSAEAMENAAGLGFEKSHLIGMQGPFSEELNRALLRQTGAVYLVTKETGTAGGFGEKLSAAASCGVTAVVVTRPVEADGMSVEEVCAAMEVFVKSSAKSFTHDKRDKEPEVLPFISLVGIGPGAVSQMTGGAVEAIRSSGVLFGAPRVLRAVRPLLTDGQVTVERYLAEDVAVWMEEDTHPVPERAALLFSGDAGFYSGAKKAARYFQERKIPFTVVAGISSVSYFAARLNTSWEDAALCTAHGREFDILSALGGETGKVFLLLGGENSAGRVCGTLCGGGFWDAAVSVGENLSYPDERIVRGTAEELKGLTTGPLCLMLVDVTGCSRR